MDSPETINGLALCYGAGGLELGIRIALPNYRTIAISEGEAYCLAATCARIEEGSLDECFVAPDLRQLDARFLRGRVDIVTAGFPCQPHSLAGKRAGTTDTRWLWPDIARIIDECRPECVFLENVAGLLRDAASDLDPEEDVGGSTDDAIGGMGTVLRDLASLGFDAEWVCLRASDFGASHQRKRVFILAYPRQPERWRPEKPASFNWCTPASSDHWGTGRALADASRRRSSPELVYPNRERFQDRSNRPETIRIDDGRPTAQKSSAIMAVTARAEGERFQQQRQHVSGAADGALGEIFAPGPQDSRWENLLVRYPWLRPAVSQAEIESDLCNLADGVADLVADNRTDALRALGNGVVPIQCAQAFMELSQRARRRMTYYEAF